MLRSMGSVKFCHACRKRAASEGRFSFSVSFRMRHKKADAGYSAPALEVSYGLEACFLLISENLLKRDDFHRTEG